VGVVKLRRFSTTLRWGAPVGLLALLLVAAPALALAQPPADPTVTIVNTGSGGLVLLTDTRGRRLALGGSAAGPAASTALDRHLPPWDRHLDLLLVPPPHAAHLPGALGLLERRAVTQASLLALAARPDPAIDAWQAQRPRPPVVGRAMVALDGDARLLLDTGDEPAGGAALALVERGEARLLLLFGAAAPLALARHAAGHLPAPTAVARLTPQAGPLAAPLSPALVISLDSPTGSLTATPPTIALAAGESLRVVLRPDRLRIQGDLGASLDVEP
jgi:hypothetical protein